MNTYWLFTSIYAALLSFLCFWQTAQAATNATAQQITCNAQVNFGLSQYGNSSLLSYTEPTTTTALFNAVQTIVVPAATDNYQVDLSTTFPFMNDALVFGVKDISNPGQQVDIGMASGGQRFSMAANGFFLIRVDGSAPILYIDNPSDNEAAILQVFTLSN